MRISPKYYVKDWQALSFSTEEDWQKAVDVFEDRIYGRFLVPISLMQGYEFAGFAIMALDCLLIETLQQFKQGLFESESSRDAFVRFLTESSFKSYFDDKKATLFYKQFRCGILHQAETKESSLIRIDSHLVSYSGDKKGLVINRCLFHEQLLKELENYISQLRDSSNIDLRKKFRGKMDFICRLKFVYFAYDSNMNSTRLSEQVPSAESKGSAKLQDWRVVRSKKGKVNVEPSTGDIASGELFEINSSELSNLDGAKKGYKRTCLKVVDSQHNESNGSSICSEKTTNDIKPHSWYKNFIVKGACEYHLPPEYIELLKSIEAKPD